MKKKSVYLLVSDILLTFFLVTMSSYLVFAFYSLKQKTELSDNFAEVLLSEHNTLLFVFAGAVVLFLSFVAGWTAFVVNKKKVIKIAAVVLGIGNTILILGAVMAFAANPAYSLASLLFAIFFVPSTVLSWLALILKK